MESPAYTVACVHRSSRLCKGTRASINCVAPQSSAPRYISSALPQQGPGDMPQVKAEESIGVHYNVCSTQPKILAQLQPGTLLELSRDMHLSDEMMNTLG